MAFEIEWTKRADREFEEIIGYLATEWSYRGKTISLKIFYQKLDVISHFPDIGVSISKRKKSEEY